MSHPLSKDILNLAHDISAAVFRVARVVKNTKLKTALEDAAVDLVSSPADGTVDKLLMLVKLAASAKEIKTLNAEVLDRELNFLSDMIQETINKAISEASIGNEEEPDLAESFAELSATQKPISSSLNKEYKSNGNIAIRQSAILAYIRELPSGCRMRDLLVKFPDVSERTLRNDLQDLNAGGLVERLGKGAFSSFRAVTKHEIIAL